MRQLSRGHDFLSSPTGHASGRSASGIGPVIVEPLEPSRRKPGADQTVGRADGLSGGLDADPALPESEDFGASDVILGQVQKGSGSIRARGQVNRCWRRNPGF